MPSVFKQYKAHELLRTSEQEIVTILRRKNLSPDKVNLEQLIDLLRDDARDRLESLRFHSIRPVQKDFENGLTCERDKEILRFLRQNNLDPDDMNFIGYCDILCSHATDRLDAVLKENPRERD